MSRTTTVTSLCPPPCYSHSSAMFKPRKHDCENLPPGPWRLPVIGSMHHLIGALPHHAMRDLARRYDAPLMLLRLGELDVVVASSAGAAREILKTHDAVFATRPRTATLRAIARDDLGISLAPHGEHWRRLRKLCVTELLSAPQVRSLRGCREAKAAALVSSIASSLSSSSEPVNVSSLITTHVTDLAVHAVMGDRNRDLRDEFLGRVDEGIQLTAGFSLADLFPSSRLAHAFSGSIRRAEALSHETSLLMDQIIEEHRTRRSAGAGDEKEDIVDVLLRVQNDGSLHVPLDDGTIRAVIIDMFSGGSMTSVTTLQWVMSELMRSPVALRRVQAEVRGALMGESCIREEALQEMHYLHLVIKETLRLHPVVPLLLPRECQEPCRVLGYDVPKGAMVLVNAWAIGRDYASWAPDADEFRPERFVEAGDAAANFRGTNFELVPFGAGRRMCPGITFGLAIVDLMLASLLFHFDWQLPGGGARGLDMAEELGITARRKSDLWLHATDKFSGGSETSATTLQWAMSELMRSPVALRRMQSEVRGALMWESCIREEALQELHYLHLIIKETLRLHPVVALLLPWEYQEPCRVLGYDVPKGVMVLVNSWAIGRDSASWGPDADEFRPERFVEAGDAAADFRGTNFELVPFGAGRRMCPRITFGLVIVELMLASLLFHFNWELPGEGTHGLDMAEELGIKARRKSDLWLHATVHVSAPHP